MTELIDPDIRYQSTQLIIKPTSACNFNCTFCSARFLDIPIHDKVPESLKDYICKLKPTNIFNKIPSNNSITSTTVKAKLNEVIKAI